MGHWLSSGRRRDLCVLLYGTGGLRGQELKARLEERYGTRLEPRTFYGALDALVEKGHLEERTEGLHDVYALTDAGRAALEAHYEWVDGQLAAGEAGDGHGDVDGKGEGDEEGDDDGEGGDDGDDDDGEGGDDGDDDE